MQTMCKLKKVSSTLKDGTNSKKFKQSRHIYILYIHPIYKFLIIFNRGLFSPAINASLSELVNIIKSYNKKL